MSEITTLYVISVVAYPDHNGFTQSQAHIRQESIMMQAYQGTALITGASTGIGAVYAERLARRGYDLILVARSRARLIRLAGRIAIETGRSVEILDADLNDPASRATVEAKLKEDASITLLVNNAGVGTHTPLLDSDVNAMTRMIDLNVNALTHLTYAAAPGFVSRGKGTIVNVSSVVSIAPERLNGLYGGTKAFVLAFSQSLHRELASKGVTVQAVLPGATATDFWRNGGLPIENLDPAIVMSAEDMVDAALVGLERGELVTIPSLHDGAKWDVFEAALGNVVGTVIQHACASLYRRGRTNRPGCIETNARMTPDTLTQPLHVAVDAARLLTRTQRSITMSIVSPAHTRRSLLAYSIASALALSVGSAFSHAQAASVVDQPSANPGVVAKDDSIRPFHVHVPNATLVDLRRRIAATRWPDKETVADQSQGVQSAKI
ncbi:MAG: Short-chain dehydrogenases of various substrate specificities [uncultured Paraburkholderia sp.]|nr:MAG: Short-chain dehydrogenases of various substrate specificities [uncultured Paraburkholderia sp.]